MTEYLKLHRLTTKEQIENHIIELKRNTFVDEVLIFNLSVFNSFSGNNFWNKSLDWNLGAKDPKDFVLIELHRNPAKTNKTENMNRLTEEELEKQRPKEEDILEMLTIQAINKFISRTPMTYLDEVTEDLSNSTRHKSKNGETHSETTATPPITFSTPNTTYIKASPFDLSSNTGLNVVGYCQASNTISTRIPAHDATSSTWGKRYCISPVNGAVYTTTTPNTGNISVSNVTTDTVYGTSSNTSCINTSPPPGFFSQGIKETNNKADYSEINLNILDLMAERFSKNKDKYPKGNSNLPLDKTDLYWAAFRHIKKIITPIKDDTESLKDHLAAILCNCSMILNQIEIEEK